MLSLRKDKIESKSLMDEGSIARSPRDYGQIIPYPTMAYKGKLRPKGVLFTVQVYWSMWKQG